MSTSLYLRVDPSSFLRDRTAEDSRIVKKCNMYWLGRLYTHFFCHVKGSGELTQPGGPCIYWSEVKEGVVDLYILGYGLSSTSSVPEEERHHLVAKVGSGQCLELHFDTFWKRIDALPATWATSLLSRSLQLLQYWCATEFSVCVCVPAAANPLQPATFGRNQYNREKSDCNFFLS